MDPNAVVGVVVGVLGLVGLLSAAFAVNRAATTKQTLELMKIDNDECRATNKELRQEVATLRGQVEVLRSDVVGSLLKGFRTELQSLIKEVQKGG